MIKEKEYIEYINNNPLTHCQKKELMNYYKSKYQNYIEPNSNNQINYYIKYVIQENDIESICRIKLLLEHFVNIDIVEKIINKLIKNKTLLDSEIIQLIIKYNKSSKKIKEKNENCDKWTYAIEFLSLLYLNSFKPKDIKDMKYLDIGCGSGKKTLLFSKYMNISKDNINGTDIKTWGPYQKNKKKLSFKFKYIENNKLSYSNNSFDVITCILTLHHVEKLEKFIKEIYRILKHNGIFILIEHCVNTDIDRMTINIQHMLYSALYDKQENYIENPIYMQLFNDNEWNYIMNENNFTCLDKNILHFGNKFLLKNNYDNIFYGIYKK